MSRSSPSIALRACLGTGGFGEVYLGRFDGRDVAVKVLHHGLDPRSQAVQRLRDEARLLHLLDHPSILSIEDLVLLDGRVALITEYIAGADLEDLLDPADPIPRAAGADALQQVATALQAAYTTVDPRGRPLHLLHRDIKPGNIRVGRDGRVKLLDFGIAKATGVTREARTQGSSVLGSFAYMAPERFDPRRPDGPQGDVYSLGCVLFEVLSGGALLLEGYEVRDLFSLGMSRDARDDVIRARLATLRVGDGPLALLTEMLAWEPAQRPALADAADRLDQVAGELDGERLIPWCRMRAWTPPGSAEGALSGRTLAIRPVGDASPGAADLAPPRVVEPATPRASEPRPQPLLAEPAPSTLPPELSIAPARSGGLDPLAISIGGDPRSPVPPEDRRESSGSGYPRFAWSAVLLGATGLGVAAGAVVGAALWFGLLADGPPAETPEPGPAAPVVSPAPAAPVPSPTEPRARPARPVPRPALPTPGPVAGPSPVAVPAPAPAPAPAELACADLGSLGPSIGRLPDAVLVCLERRIAAGDDRVAVARVQLADAAARCRDGRGCDAYERLAPRFLAEIEPGAPDVLGAWTEHLLARETEPERVPELLPEPSPEPTPVDPPGEVPAPVDALSADPPDPPADAPDAPPPEGG